MDQSDRMQLAVDVAHERGVPIDRAMAVVEDESGGKDD